MWVATVMRMMDICFHTLFFLCVVEIKHCFHNCIQNNSVKVGIPDHDCFPMILLPVRIGGFVPRPSGGQRSLVIDL